MTPRIMICAHCGRTVDPADQRPWARITVGKLIVHLCPDCDQQRIREEQAGTKPQPAQQGRVILQ